jgi:hypothetical protein
MLMMTPDSASAPRTTTFDTAFTATRTKLARLIGRAAFNSPVDSMSMAVARSHVGSADT